MKLLEEDHRRVLKFYRLDPALFLVFKETYDSYIFIHIYSKRTIELRR